MEQVHVAFAANHQYWSGLIVSAVSMAESASSSARIIFHLLLSGITEDEIDQLRRQIALRHREFQVFTYEAGASILSGLPLWKGNVLAYARLLLPNLLMNISHVVYSDVDFIWNADVADLWKLRSSQYALVAVRDDPKSVDEELSWFKERELRFHGEYFCSGMILMNLDCFRKRDVLSQALTFMRTHPDIRQADQTPLNFLLQGHTKMIDRKWQTLSYTLMGEIHPGIAIHYAGESPWNPMASRSDVLTDRIIFWHQVHANIVGGTVWQSLRRFYSPLTIIVRRGMFLWASNKVLRWGLFLPFMSFGYRGTVDKLIARCHRVDWRSCGNLCKV